MTVSLLIPFLTLLLFFQKITKRRGTLSFLIGAFCSLLILKTYINGLSVNRWIASFSETWSIPLAVILVVLIFENYFSKTIFSSSDWKIIWLFGAIASLVLYPSALGLGRFDIYSLGWHSKTLVFVITAVGVVSLWKRNRLGIILLLSLAAWNLHLQASSNFLDYLVDPVYGMLSLLIVLYWGVRSIKRS